MLLSYCLSSPVQSGLRGIIRLAAAGRAATPLLVGGTSWALRFPSPSSRECVLGLAWLGRGGGLQKENLGCWQFRCALSSRCDWSPRLGALILLSQGVRADLTAGAERSWSLGLVPLGARVTRTIARRAPHPQGPASLGLRGGLRKLRKGSGVKNESEKAAGCFSSERLLFS